MLVFGPTAQAFFDDTVANHGDTLLGFDGLSGDLSMLSGVTFQTVAGPGDVPVGPHNVEVSNLIDEFIVGTPGPGGFSDDGRYRYEIIFPEPLPRAGLLRRWNTSTITEFYNESGVLLDSHQNTVNIEFVGWNTTSSDPNDLVKRIKITGIDDQVGYSDNVTFGSTVVAIPEPLAYASFLGMLGLGFAWIRRRKRASALGLGG